MRPRTDKNAADPCGLLAFSIYFVLSLTVFGGSLSGHWRDFHIGFSQDPSLFMWFLVWWPHAIVHRLNPFSTDFIWAPVGMNLAWTTCIPLPAVLAWPVTAWLGPIAAFNLLSLLAPPLAAWSAFLLCRHVSKSWWPSLLGGYVFGFSAYMLCHESAGHLHMTLVFLVPLAGLAAARAIDGEFAAGRLIAMLAAILAAQFLISIEVFTTMTVFGAVAVGLGWAFAPAETAGRIKRMIVPVLCAYAVTAVIVSPYIYWLFGSGMLRGEIWKAERNSADLMNFVIPTPTNEFGRFPFFIPLWAPFCDSRTISETGAYFGLPLLIVAMLYAMRNWRKPLARVIAGSFLIASVLALGPRLHLNGAALFALPSGALLALPGLEKALPARLTIYSFLCLAIMTSVWFAANRIGRAANAALAAMVILFTLPQFSAAWTTAAGCPAFFATGIYRRYLAAGENVLVLPFGFQGGSMLWQAETEMYFRMAGGWTGLQPPEFSEWPIYEAFVSPVPVYLPDAAGQLGAFIAQFDVDAVVVADDSPQAAAWGALLSNFCAIKRSAGGATVYRPLASALERWHGASALQMRRRASSIAIDGLLLAAGNWLSAGYGPAQLTSVAAFQRGLLKAAWFSKPITAADLPNCEVIERVDSKGHLVIEKVDSKGLLVWGAWLGTTADGQIAVGIDGRYLDLEPTIARLRKSARHIYFPYPRDLVLPGTAAPDPNQSALLEMVFDRDQVLAIAAQLKARGFP